MNLPLSLLKADSKETDEYHTLVQRTTDNDRKKISMINWMDKNNLRRYNEQNLNCYSEI